MQKLESQEEVKKHTEFPDEKAKQCKSVPNLVHLKSAAIARLGFNTAVFGPSGTSVTTHPTSPPSEETVQGALVRRLARAEDDAPVRASGPPKSLSVEDSFRAQVRARQIHTNTFLLQVITLVPQPLLLAIYVFFRIFTRLVVLFSFGKPNDIHSYSHSYVLMIILFKE